jgi:hypothetical protein
MCHYILYVYIYLYIVYSQLSMIMKTKDTRIIKKHRQSQFWLWLGDYGHYWIQKFRNVHMAPNLIISETISHTENVSLQLYSHILHSNKYLMIYAHDTCRNTYWSSWKLVVNQTENWNGSTILHKILQYLISWKYTWPFSSCFMLTDRQ